MYLINMQMEYISVKNISLQKEKLTPKNVSVQGYLVGQKIVKLQSGNFSNLYKLARLFGTERTSISCVFSNKYSSKSLLLFSLDILFILYFVLLERFSYKLHPPVSTFRRFQRNIFLNKNQLILAFFILLDNIEESDIFKPFFRVFLLECSLNFYF